MHALSLFFFFNDTATTEIYTLSLHDALPISPKCASSKSREICCGTEGSSATWRRITCASSLKLEVFRCSRADRKSTRLNSSHLVISYAVFCLKKKNANEASVAPCSALSQAQQ